MAIKQPKKKKQTISKVKQTSLNFSEPKRTPVRRKKATPAKKSTPKKKPLNLTTCSGSGRALRSSSSAGVRKTASKNLNGKCKAKAVAKRKAKK
jgi:hypothetical protein